MTRDDLRAELVSSILEYDKLSGVFRWKARPGECGNFNSKYAGKVAGSIDKKTGYIRISINNKLYQAHRLAWLMTYGEWPDEHDLDHKDMNRSNNAISNLREAKRSRNKGNQRKYATNTAGYKGVSFRKDKDMFTAGIGVNGRRIHLGYFATARLAAEAYNAAAVKHFGEFARLNDITTKE